MLFFLVDLEISRGVDYFKTFESFDNLFQVNHIDFPSSFIIQLDTFLTKFLPRFLTLFKNVLIKGENFNAGEMNCLFFLQVDPFTL